MKQFTPKMKAEITMQFMLGQLNKCEIKEKYFVDEYLLDEWVGLIRNNAFFIFNKPTTTLTSEELSFIQSEI
jgi:hypothetical protein